MFFYKNIYYMSSNSQLFNSIGRIGNDECSVLQNNLQNTKSGTYRLTNFGVADCNMTKPMEFALQQPNVFYNGSHQVGLGGCNINTNTQLRIGKAKIDPKEPISLHQRPYLTVPYLGRGAQQPELESKLLQGDQVSNRKSASNLSEKSYKEYHHVPLLEPIQSTITNPSFLVESEAAPGWIRGGIPSRELSRDKEYLYKNNSN
jgi:hypothetical protein